MLSGKEIVKTAKRIIKSNPEYFEALVEFEKTGKLPKLNYKERFNFSLDTEIMRKFREYCRKQGMKMSTKVERLILEELKKGS